MITSTEPACIEIVYITTVRRFRKNKIEPG